MASTENVKPLKILVFSLALLLAGGTALLVALTVKKMPAESADAHRPAPCIGGALDLKGHGTMVDSRIQGQTLYATFEKADGKSEIVMIDICAARATGALALTTDSAPLEQ